MGVKHSLTKGRAWNEGIGKRNARGISEHNRQETTAGFINLHNEELHNLYPSPRIIMVIKSLRIGWVRCTAHMGEMGNA
jgi:hypothetical protein